MDRPNKTFKGDVQHFSPVRILLGCCWWVGYEAWTDQAEIITSTDKERKWGLYAMNSRRLDVVCLGDLPGPQHHEMILGHDRVVLTKISSALVIATVGAPMGRCKAILLDIEHIIWH